MSLDFPSMRIPPELPNDVAWYVRHVINEYLREHPEATDPSVAALVGSTKQTIGRVRNGLTRAGTNLATKVAEKLCRVSWEEFKRRAAREHKKQPSAEITTEYVDRYPNRAAVLRLLSPELHPETIKRAKQIALKSDDDVAASEWIDDIRSLDRKVRRELAHPERAAEERAAKRRQVEEVLDAEDNDRSR